MRRFPTLCLTCALALAVVVADGCGEGGVEGGAIVSVYVAAPLCKSAQVQLKREGDAVEDLRIRVVCLPPTESNGRVDLAQIGANARRASEDSTAIAYLETPGPAAKFSQTIVESADIAWTQASSGATGMRRVLQALASGDTSSPRATVRESLDGS